MKKLIISLLILGMIVSLVGCGNDSTETTTDATETVTTADADDEITKAETDVSEESDDTTVAEDNLAAIADSSTSSEDGIDLDLTTLSSTMVYSEVFNMMTDPSEYIGKTVKMTGAFAYYHDDTTDTDYYSCIVQDATACCSQGIEFDPGDSYTYPDDFPAEGDEITVVGTFETYDEGSYTYCTLRNAEMTYDE